LPIVGEIISSAHSVAFGANPHAATFFGAPAVGRVVNGLNRSGNPVAKVRGIDIVDGGSAGTQWALGIETSISEPAGIPGIGIALAGETIG
jgi:hypothetical protein